MDESNSFGDQFSHFCKRDRKRTGHCLHVLLGGGGGALKGSLTLTLFETKSVRFATLFKTRDLYILPVFCVFCLPCFSFPIQKVFF